VAISGRLLNAGEHVVVSTRTHGKVLLVPAVLLVVVAATAGFATSYPTVVDHAVLLAVVWGLALLVVVWRSVLPFLRWLTTTFTLTDRRLITRNGILSRSGRDIPLARVNDVAYEHGIVDRMLGCGTLVVSDASERGQVRLPDIPHVEEVHLQLSDLLFSGQHGEHGRDGYGERRDDDGT
jgi:uncharacterized membrane protein YdbT with pleckstrin-like domain